MKIMADLDKLEKQASEGKKGKGKADMKGAVDGTEAIRKWVSHNFFLPRSTDAPFLYFWGKGASFIVAILKSKILASVGRLWRH